MVYMHVYIHTYTDTFTHSYIHTYTCLRTFIRDYAVQLNVKSMEIQRHVRSGDRSLPPNIENFALETLV
jgi:hypothetical protein